MYETNSKNKFINTISNIQIIHVPKTITGFFKLILFKQLTRKFELWDINPYSV